MQEIVNRLSANQGDDVKEKINLAYLEGLKNSPDKATDKGKQTAVVFKYLAYAFLIYIGYKFLFSDSAVGPGSGGKGFIIK